MAAFRCKGFHVFALRRDTHFLHGALRMSRISLTREAFVTHQPMFKCNSSSADAGAPNSWQYLRFLLVSCNDDVVSMHRSEGMCSRSNTLTAGATTCRNQRPSFFIVGAAVSQKSLDTFLMQSLQRRCVILRQRTCWPSDVHTVISHVCLEECDAELVNC